MKDITILKGLYSALDALYPATPIILPNEPIASEIASTDVFFEIANTGRTWTRETEESTLSTTVCSIIINGRQNTGIGAVDTIADALVDNFTPLNPATRNGFTFVDEARGVVSRAYVTETSRSESGTYNGRFKVTVFITLEIFEDKHNG